MNDNNIAVALREPLAGSVRVPGDLAKLRAKYAAAGPFPHVVIDDLFEPALLEGLLAEARALKPEQLLVFEREDLERTERMSSPLELGRVGSAFVSLLHSAPFLYLLSEITDMWQLLPDPYLQGAGHAVMRRGDFFEVHADRSVAYDTGLVRRLAMIVFLNKDWSADYGGCLELWNPAGTQREVSVEPVFNRTVLFEVAYPNYHGVPQPLTCPDTRARRSFIVYFHTAGSGGNAKVTAHSSRFAPLAYRRKEHVLLRLARQLTPPVVRSALSRLRRRKEE
jgi:2OG-Fe(II) oxygenase superfamily